MSTKDRDKYIELMADLLNRNPDARERERLVREANRQLYRAVVSSRDTDAQADLALAEAAQRARSR